MTRFFNIQQIEDNIVFWNRPDGTPLQAGVEAGLEVLPPEAQALYHKHFSKDKPYAVSVMTLFGCDGVGAGFDFKYNWLEAKLGDQPTEMHKSALWLAARDHAAMLAARFPNATILFGDIIECNDPNDDPEVAGCKIIVFGAGEYLGGFTAEMGELAKTIWDDVFDASFAELSMPEIVSADSRHWWIPDWLQCAIVETSSECGSTVVAMAPTRSQAIMYMRKLLSNRQAGLRIRGVSYETDFSEDGAVCELKEKNTDGRNRVTRWVLSEDIRVVRWEV